MWGGGAECVYPLCMSVQLATYMEGKCNQYWSLIGPVLVSYSDQYYFAS